MPDKDPTTWNAATWALGFLMAIAGGLVSWFAGFKSGHAKTFNKFAFAGEIFTSGFVGLSVFFLLTSMGMHMGVCAAGAGIGGHMGARLLIIAEGIFEVWIVKFKNKL